MSMKDLINKSKGLNNETKSTEKAPIIQQSVIPRNKPFKLGIGMESNKPVSTDEKQSDTVLNKKRTNSPFAGLKDAIPNSKSNSELSIKNILGNTANKTPQTTQTNNAESAQIQQPLQQNTSNPPTLGDLDKYVFEEQPDESTEEIAAKFSGMLDSLSMAVGSDIPKVLSDTLLFMKTHSFLATLLKPEEIGELVKTMGRSYGYVANNQTQKSEKKKKKTVEQNQILNSLDSLSF